jgi:HK97 family phage prohead protease/HK97 family phage major capsid protein
MGLRNRWRFLTQTALVAADQPEPATESVAPGRRGFTVDIPPELSGYWTSASGVQRVSRAEALSVPAVLRARNLIAGGLGVLPLHLVDPQRRTVPSSLLDQPEAAVPRSVTMTMAFEDLLLEGVAWWRIRKFAWTGYPETVERVEPSRVAVTPNGQVHVDGVHVPDAELIRFDSPNPGLLTVAARAIRTCLLLDQAAARYAAEPMPSGYFAPADGADPADDTEIQAILDDWGVARNTRATGYIPASLKYNTVQWSPEQLQLADARQHAVLEIARAAGVSPEDLGVSTTSRSYSNLEMDQQRFVTETLQLPGQAVADRLSMGDVTPRGYRVRVEYGGRLRTDTAGRYAAYAVGLDVGALAPDEIRELEDKPTLTAGQRPKPAPAPIPAQEAPVMQQNARPAPTHRNGPIGFDADATSTFDFPAGTQFQVDQGARTITGLAAPYGPTAYNKGAEWRFHKGSLKWTKSAVNRVKLLRDHDHKQPIGVAVRLTDTDAGLEASFKVARGAEGDRALELAEDGVLDGLSVGVEFAPDGWSVDADGVRDVSNAALTEISLTAMPGYTDARLTSVKASRTTEMEHAVPETQTGEAPPAVDTAAFSAALDGFTAAFTQATERLTVPQGEREVIPAGRTATGFRVTEPPVYTFDAGHGPSIVKDTFNARANGDPEATDRLRKFAAQQAEIAQFATVNRTVGANVIPPGYRPDLYVPQLFQGRPLFDLLSKGTLTDATPFTIPKFGTATGATADHVEGTNPADGTLTLGSVTVTPGGISGRFRITREIIDSSNPAIDAIAMAAMKESYAQQTEGKVYTALNGATGQGGTITSGFVPSGAAVVTATGVGSTGAAGVALLDTLRDQLVAYPFRRFAAPNRLALAQEAATQLAKAKDSSGRPLLPRIGAMNALGTVETLNQAFDVDGLPGVPAWSMTGNAAGDADTLLWNAQDVWAWESSVSTFRYEEVAGPANVDLVLFAYFAVSVVRASGISAIRLTVT